MIKRWIYTYPIALGFKELEVSETFVTFDEPNLFIEPYDNSWIKLAATVIYLIGLSGSCIQYTFVVYEVNGYAASFRTAINQLVSSCYFLVSYTKKLKRTRISRQYLIYSMQLIHW